MVLGGVGWDKKKFLESNLHVYGGDDIKVVVYNMGRWPKKSRRKKPRNLVMILLTLITLFINKIL